MDLLKTPQQKLMEEAGVSPASPGMLNTPQQLLMQEAGMIPHLANGGQPHSDYPLFGQNAEWRFGVNEAPDYPQYVPQKQADGGSIQMSPQDMLASLVASGHLPEHYALGGGVKNVATQAALTLPGMTEELSDIGKDIANDKYTSAALKTGAAGYSAFTPWNPLTALISGMTYSPEAGAGSTLDEWLAAEELRKNPPKQAPAPEKKRSLLYQKTMVK